MDKLKTLLMQIATHPRVEDYVKSSQSNSINIVNVFDATVFCFTSNRTSSFYLQ